MNAFELRDAGISTRRGVRLAQTSMTIAAGSITMLVGPNGAGKSSLVSLLAGELAPTAGSVEMQGRPVSAMRPIERARARAVLDQGVEVSFPFSVADVVSWGRWPWRGTERAKDDLRLIEESLRSQGLVELRTRSIHELSGGEQRRVHIARVLAQDAPILLLDEADAELDLVGRRHLDDVMLSQRAQGRTVVVSSHDVTRVAAISDMAVVLAAGSVLAVGRPEQVLTSELLTRAFGRPVEVHRDATGLVIRLP